MSVFGGFLARINIEDSLFKDNRWQDLLIKTGCKYKSLGLVSTAWMLAQQNWLKHGAIPQKAWPKELEILIQVELAERRENGSIYVKGSKRAFTWLNQKSQAGQRASENKLEALKRARVARWNKDDLEKQALPNPLSSSDGSLKSLRKSDFSDNTTDTDSVKSNVRELALNGSERTTNGSEAPSLILSLTQEEYKNTTTNVVVTDGGLKKPPAAPARAGAFDAKTVEEVFASIAISTKQRWVALYPNREWLTRTATRAVGYYLDNANKKPKSARGWAQSISIWLEKDWGRHAKFEKGQSGGSVDWQQVFGGSDA